MLLSLASQDLYKTVFNYEPSQMQSLFATINLAWSVKILYGLISDNIPIFGSKRKSYLVIGAFIQVLTMSLLATFGESSPFLAAFCIFATTLSIAFSDVIVDSLLIIQARKDPQYGSEDLQSFSWYCQAAGGFFGATTAAFLTQNFAPSMSFGLYAIFGLALFFSALRIDGSTENCD